MNIFRHLKARFLVFFRDLLVYHNSSLEFRAKILAAMIGANRDMDECELEILQEIAKEIYPDDEARVDVLIRTVKEYVDKIIMKNDLDVNDLIKNIDSILKAEPRFAQKINTKRLSRLMKCSEGDEETQIIQRRIIEFLEREKEEFEKTLYRNKSS